MIVDFVTLLNLVKVLPVAMDIAKITLIVIIYTGRTKARNDGELQSLLTFNRIVL